MSWFQPISYLHECIGRLASKKFQLRPFLQPFFYDWVCVAEQSQGCIFKVDELKRFIEVRSCVTPQSTRACMHIWLNTKICAILFFKPHSAVYLNDYNWHFFKKAIIMHKFFIFSLMWNAESILRASSIYVMNLWNTIPLNNRLIVFFKNTNFLQLLKEWIKFV